MYFKKLELVGFKSFMDKTTLHFEPGITAVVGPNGCGKSNVFDSIRWVLGEQSVKALRGSAMQDVIFNGSDAKEPLGMAEVSLTFDNDKKYFSIDHNEVVITRRIFRSGESEYLLNKAAVRLKDILDLFMGTGIGAESYSLVEQGKIDLILSVKPEDRRLVFDEAAGITKYKAQKKEAMRKLEETEQNLLRINDIIVEVKRQISSLERQATKARRYKEVYEELKSKEIDFALLQKNILLQEKDAIINELEQLKTQELQLLNIIQDKEANISASQTELKAWEDQIMQGKNQILNLENLAIRHKQHLSFNQEKIRELEANQKHLSTQIEQTKNRLILDEEKLNNVRTQHQDIKKNIEEKTRILKDAEEQLNSFTFAIKSSLENISKAKRDTLDLVTEITRLKNNITDLTNQQQIYGARKKRLELEKAKVNAEKADCEAELKHLEDQLNALEKDYQDLKAKITELKNALEQETPALNKIDVDLEDLEKQKLTLSSHKEFLEKLKTKYEDISESMNAIIYLDNLPDDKVTGLVVKLKDIDKQTLKLTGEAKPIDLDTQRIAEKLKIIEENLENLKNSKDAKLARIEELHKSIQAKQEDLRNFEINLANKKTFYESVLEQFNNFKEEEDIIVLELGDVEKELSQLEEEVGKLRFNLSEFEHKQKSLEDLIHNEEKDISLKSDLKEKSLISITQLKTELDALSKQINSDEATLKILEDTYKQDKESFANIQTQTEDNQEKKESLLLEIKDLEDKLKTIDKELTDKSLYLKETEEKYKNTSSGLNGVIKKIEWDRKEIETLKNKLHQLQMQDKDAEFKILSVKERMLQAYKIDLDELVEVAKELNADTLLEEIKKLKEKLDSYGTVNLVAIEEYDELKKRYDFLTQQQNDLNSAKESLQEAILKINRTTKKMFQETFEKVGEEFRNYFRLLFNGGDAKIFLIDEEDPLESGIEIICRPPGKRLQNVLLLSGGEKSLSAIALIFAIFKVRPSPFCILDEIDAALDEANVDRFSRILQEFAKNSQFIVITHNKKTIAKADIMYGITMEGSGVSKIVSVKFAKDKMLKDKEPNMAVAEPV